MDKYLRVHTPMSGFVRIEIATGNLDWESEDLDPVAMKYAEKYLVIEGFVEQAIGALDPAPDSEVKAILDSILFS
jgi:hypothetical protein